MNDIAQPRKRGRVKGSSDSTNISVAELLKRFGPEALVPIRRTWLDKQTPVEHASHQDGDALPANLHEVEEDISKLDEKIQFEIR
jgi:hypothetical protein